MSELPDLLTRHKPAAIILLLIFVAAATLPALWGGFISDDHSLIQSRATLLKNPGTFGDLIRNVFWWGTGETTKRDLYRPWVSATYWLEYQVAGARPLVFHLSNQLVHLANIALLLVLLTPLIGFARALLIAGLFGASPAAVTCVGWIAGRTDLWATLFTLLFLIAFRAGAQQRRVFPLAASLVFLFLALCSKEIAVAGPVIAWLLDRTTALNTVRPARRKSPASHYAWLILPLAAYFFLRRAAVHTTLPRGMDLEALAKNISYLAEQVVRTAEHLLIPLHYQFFSEPLYSDPGRRGLGFVVMWILFLAWTILIVEGLRRRKLWAVGGVWFALPILPVYAFGHSFAFAADFYVYLGMAGFWLFVTDGARELMAKFPTVRRRLFRIAQVVALGAVVVFGVLTWARLPLLRSDYSLMSHMSVREPRSVKVMVKLAEAYMMANDQERALKWLYRAVAVDSLASDPRCMIAKILMDRGDLHGAAPHVDVLAEHATDKLEPVATVARFYFEAGHCPEAVSLFRQAFTLDMPSPEVLYDYGLALICTGEYGEARDVYIEALHWRPSWPRAHQNLGICCENLGDLEGAVAAYQEALREDSTLGVSWESLALVWMKRGDLVRAHRAAEAFERLNPPPDRIEQLRETLSRAGATLP